MISCKSLEVTDTDCVLLISGYVRKKKLHSNLEGFQCKLCGNEYAVKNAVVRHIRNIHGGDVGPFACQSCKKICKNKDALRTHIYNYHKIMKGAKN